MAKTNKRLPAHLKHMTQYTREQMDGKKEPTRSMTNRITTERPKRRAAWLKKQEEAKANV